MPLTGRMGHRVPGEYHASERAKICRQRTSGGCWLKPPKSLQAQHMTGLRVAPPCRWAGSPTHCSVNRPTFQVLAQHIDPVMP